MRRAARWFKSFRRAAHHGRMSRGGAGQIRKVLDEAVTRIEHILDEDSRR